MPPSHPTQTFDAIILGAGAAGLFCALHAGRRNRRVLLLDHAEKAGKKILISGGGRCNFTNLHTAPENFLSTNPHFARSALSRYTPQDFIALVREHDIPFHEKTLGQLFCDHSAHDIVTMLERECAAANVRTLLGVTIHAVAGTQPTTDNPQPTTRFTVDTSAGLFHAASIVIATGGLSIPRMGATGLGYDLARRFGINLIPTRPALVPLVLSPEDQASWCDLNGLSAEAIATTAQPTKAKENISLPKTEECHPERSSSRIMRTEQSKDLRFIRAKPPSFQEKLLITHRGLSGPVILQASSYWRPGEPIHLDLAPGRNLTQHLLPPRARRDRNTLALALRDTLPARLAERWLTLHPPPSWKNAGLEAFERQLHQWTITPAGTEGYARAEVTAGGIDTNELDARTMQSKRIPGLFFIGEVVDVTGWLGGYNFQWAWASAHAAAQAL